MYISFRPLFHLLIDRGIKDTQLPKIANITVPTLTKLRNNESVTTPIIGRICSALNCQPGDIMEFVAEGDAPIVQKRTRVCKTKAGILIPKVEKK